MRYYSSSADFYYETSASTLNYYITVNGEAIYNGKAVKSPDRDKISVNIGKRVRDYIRIGMPDFRDYDGVIVPHPDAMLIFNLFNLDSGELLEQYEVKIDDTKEWEGEEGCMSEPINGHADPRQKIFYGYSSNIDVDPPTPPTPPTPPVPVPPDPSSGLASQYFTLDIIETGEFYFHIGTNTQQIPYWFHSRDGGQTWHEHLSGGPGTGPYTPVTFYAGERIFISARALIDKNYPKNPLTCRMTVATGKFNASGNILSVCFGGGNFSTGQMSTEWVGKRDAGEIKKLFSGFFRGKPVVSANDLLLPTTGLAYETFSFMFEECTELVEPPQLLMNSPNIFPESYPGYLPYTFGGTFLEMFKNCSKMNYVKCLASPSREYMMQDWLLGVKTPGVIFTNRDTWRHYENNFTNGIPSGWEVYKIQ